MKIQAHLKDTNLSRCKDNISEKAGHNMPTFMRTIKLGELELNAQRIGFLMSYKTSYK